MVTDSTDNFKEGYHVHTNDYKLAKPCQVGHRMFSSYMQGLHE